MQRTFHCKLSARVNSRQQAPVSTIQIQQRLVVKMTPPKIY